MSLFVWLGLGAVLSGAYQGRWSIPLAAWLALTALLHFTRLASPLRGFAWTWLALAIVYALVYRGVLPMPLGPYLAIIAMMALLPVLALQADHG